MPVGVSMDREREKSAPTNNEGEKKGGGVQVIAAETDEHERRVWTDFIEEERHEFHDTFVKIA